MAAVVARTLPLKIRKEC